jgi:pimeloyl-ACP methyl ester carboxylesterase
VLGCQVARRGAVDVPGVRLAYLEAGSPGRLPLLLLHGGAAHAHWFDAVLPALAARFHVVALDQRGHGESGWPVRPAYATEDFTGDVAALFDHLGWGRGRLRPIVVGHSMGGYNALAFAAWYPERLGGLVVMDTRPAIPEERLRQMRERGLRPHRLHPTLTAAVSAFHLLPPDTVADPGLLVHLAEAAVVSENGRFTLRFDPACYAERQPVDLWPLVPRVTAPTLLIRGEWSPVLPHDTATRLREALPAARLVEVAGSYHHVLLDRPAEVTAALLDFLAAAEVPS